jgi:hypothetical protein
VVETAGRAGLAFETLQGISAPRRTFTQHLDRDLPAEPLVPRPVDLAHPARSERGEDLITPQMVSNFEGHGLLSILAESITRVVDAFRPSLPCVVSENSSAWFFEE